MPLVPARCTQCGAELEVDSEKECAVCTACGTPFITEKAIVNYVTHNSYTTNVTNTTNVNAEVVHIHEDELNKIFVVEQGTLTKYNGGLDEVTVPEGVVAIGGRAFTGTSVKKVVLAKSVAEIKEGALVGIENVMIPEGSMLRKIGDGAFYRRELWDVKRKLLFLPKTLENIGKNAFDPWTLLCYEGSEEEFAKKFPALYGERKKKLPFGVGIAFDARGFGEEKGYPYAVTERGAIVCDVPTWPEEFVFPSVLGGLPVVGYSAWVIIRAASVKKLVLPEGLEVVPKDLFEGRDDIAATVVCAPASVKTVEANAFGKDWRGNLYLASRRVRFYGNVTPKYPEKLLTVKNETPDRLMLSSYGTPIVLQPKSSCKFSCEGAYFTVSAYTDTSNWRPVWTERATTSEPETVTVTGRKGSYTVTRSGEKTDEQAFFATKRVTVVNQSGKKLVYHGTNRVIHAVIAPKSTSVLELVDRAYDIWVNKSGSHYTHPKGGAGTFADGKPVTLVVKGGLFGCTCERLDG